MAKKRSARKSKASKPRKKARSRRGFANTSALSSIAPAGLATQALGGVAGFVGTGFAMQKLAERGRMRPGSMLARLDDGITMPAVTRAALALAAGWALRRFVSKPIGNAVAVGGLINAGAMFAARTLGAASGVQSIPLLGIGQAGGVDLLHPELPASLGEMDDAAIQGIIDAANGEAGMGSAEIEEGNLSPGVIAGVISNAA